MDQLRYARDGGESLGGKGAPLSTRHTDAGSGGIWAPRRELCTTLFLPDSYSVKAVAFPEELDRGDYRGS